MTITVEQRAPRVRCYKCGSLLILALCHHCWRPGCANHVRPAPSWVERLLGKEGTGKGLEKDRAYHCAECAHAPTGRRLALGTAGVAAAATGVIVAWLNLVSGLALLLVGGTVAGGAYLHLQRRAAQARVTMPLPVRPKIGDLCLIEKLGARITLGPDGKYATNPRPVEGELTMILIFGRPDRERLERQLGRRSRASSRDVRFSAGRLVLQGRVGIREGQDFPGPILALDGSTGTYPVFRTEDPHASSSWKIELPYQLSADPDLSSGLVWITPSIVPESDRRALEIEIQWIKLGPDDKLLSLDVIEMLQLRLPASWGNVEQVSERAIQGTLPEDPAGHQVVEWRQLSPGEQERQSQRLTLAVRFKNQIELEDVVCGRLEATMKGTLSGIDGVRLYGSLGGRRSLPGVSIRTRIEADFDLSLESIRYQAVRIVPDHTEDDSASAYPDEFGVIPDDETVIELTNAMSEQGYYVKRVIENPPRSGGRANLVQRYWDIAGRRYVGVYPIDFHVVLIGEEVHRGGIRPEDGTTKVRIVVKGAYTNAEMSERVEEEWKALCTLTADTLKRQEGTGRRQGWNASPAEGAVPPDASTPWLAHDHARRAQPDSRLLRRLGKLDEALLEERISPEEYREMRERAEREFGGS
jgi:hypothetical protein